MTSRNKTKHFEPRTLIAPVAAYPVSPLSKVFEGGLGGRQRINRDRIMYLSCNMAGGWGSGASRDEPVVFQHAFRDAIGRGQDWQELAEEGC